MPAPIVVADSITRVGPEAAGAVVVNASHGGVYAAYLAAKLHAAAAIFNDAGVGRDRAGIGGLDYLQEFGIAAATVGHDTARIGDGADMMARGIVTHANGLAASLGVSPGQSCRDAAAALQQAQPSGSRAAGSAGGGVPAHLRSATGLGAQLRVARPARSTRTRSSSPARMAGCSAAGRRPRSNTTCSAPSTTTPGSARTQPASRVCRRSTHAASRPRRSRRQAPASATRAQPTRTVSSAGSTHAPRRSAFAKASAPANSSPCCAAPLPHKEKP